MLTNRKAPEAEMVSRLSAMLESSWDVRHSVFFLGKEIDLVALRANEAGEDVTLAIEAKERLTVDLIDKAIGWRLYSTYTATLTRESIYPSLNAFMHKYGHVGAYLDTKRGIVTLHEPIATGALPHCVGLMAEAARKAGKGLLVQGGSASPRKATSVDLLAEEVARYYRREAEMGQCSLETCASDATPQERDAVAKFINSKDGRRLCLRARRFGSDWILYNR